ncbi:MAG: hypothetical protein L6R42_005774, partial [Xanthoria sp. 1 TBL-2021]
MACSFRTSLLTTLLFLCISSALPLALDIPSQIIANATSRINLRVKGPAAPPGFDMRLGMSSSEPLNPNHLYLCAIEAMYHLAQEEWKDTVRTGHSAIVKGLQISYYDLPDRPIDM